MNFCKYKNLGCTARIDNELLNLHYKNCKYTTCSNKYNNHECEEMGTREYIINHMKHNCNYRIVVCNNRAKCKIPFCELDYHNCNNYTVCKKIKLLKALNKNTMNISKNSAIKYRRHQGQTDKTRLEMDKVSNKIERNKEKIEELNNMYTLYYHNCMEYIIICEYIESLKKINKEIMNISENSTIKKKRYNGQKNNTIIEMNNIYKKTEKFQDKIDAIYEIHILIQ
jgi:hypothetical protein